ncbi:hypothetical protein [Serratia sp. Ag1]|uniref:hypothetical protein n=1 Tax=Serratia sp. Ag1 TaxID=1524467 RepID=UPI000504B101|nr:hypothetical protein [Serratia sp. Ag1]KFK98104.1 hypothetical protein IV04_14510 [Serratia sp. Ag1]
MSSLHANLIVSIKEKVITPLIPDATTKIVLSIESGKLVAFRNVREDEITASFDTFLHYAKQAGWKVIPPKESKDE